MEDLVAHSFSMTVNPKPHPVSFLFMTVMERDGKKRQKDSQVGWLEIKFLKGLTEKKWPNPYWIRQKAHLIQCPASTESSNRFLMKNK